MSAPIDGRTTPTTPSLRRAYVLAVVLVLVPFVVSAVAVLVNHASTPLADRALTELRVRDLGHHPVLLGLYSRDGWSHPGPLVFYTLALPYRIFGSTMTGLLVGALFVNALAIVGMATIAKRVGGVPAALLVLTAGGVVARALGADVLRDPWVCWITVLPFGVFCLLTWAMATGEIWALPVAAFVASWLAQAHIGYAPITAPGMVIAAVWLLVIVRRQEPDRARALRRTALLTVGVLAVVWAPPLWDQWFGSGNLGRAIGWFRRGEGANPTLGGVHTLAEGARVVLAQLAVVPDWVTGTRRIGVFNGETTLRTTTLLPVLLVVFVAAGIIAWRKRDRVATRLVVMLGVSITAGVLSVARTIGIMYEYRLLWTWVLGALALAAAVWVGWTLTAARRPGLATWALVASVILVLSGLGVAETVDALDMSRRTVWESPEIATAVARLTRTLDPDGGQLVLTSESFVGEWYLQGVLLALEHRGFDARVPHNAGGMYGAHRVQDRSAVQARLRVLGGSDLNGFVGRPGWQLVAYAYAGDEPLAVTARNGARLAAEQQQLLRALQRGTISTDAYARRFRALAAHVPTGLAILRQAATS